MADPSAYRPSPGTIPDAPGVYKFRDPGGRVVYVGKAKSLRSRLNSYFADITSLHPRTRQMVTTAGAVEWTVVSTEVEALQLEYNWIKEFDPRFNVRYRDDKSYPVLAVTLNEEYPRLHVYRGARKKGVRYFGPYAHAWAIRETLDLLLRVFPARTCSTGVFRRHGQIGRPCLLGYIDKCSAPCVGKVSADEHRAIVLDFCDFLSGKTDAMVRRLEKEMAQASSELEFERAARLRDDIGALRRAMEKQAVVLGDGTDADVVSFAYDELEAAVQVFHVRGGRVRGQRGWVVDRLEDAGEESPVTGLVDQFLSQFYGDQADLEDDVANSVPREVLVPELPADAEAIGEWLTGLRGSRVQVRVPQRGDKRALMETVERNAKEAFTQHKLRRAGDLTARSAALQELQDNLGLDSAPLRIECIDISHIQGSDVVASLVVFEDGLARKNEYRRFAIREAATEGDVASIAEVVRRRFAKYAGESGGQDRTPGIDPDTGKPRRFAYPPNLLVVDGAGPQANAAADVLADLGVTDVAVIGLAKRLEEVWLPAEPEPSILPRTSEALYLLQRVRDEAHRFAIAYHRQKRAKRMTMSALDDVPGLGQSRRAVLIKHFGSVKRLTAATVEEITQVPGIGLATAKAVHTALNRGEEKQ
ncbi:Excinuclease ABC subunit C [Actinokineospora alba]|uniref:UvrABC system protein C n=1 Tax=Actinokineospora alba TaxID=504798 RepID=A0A1H0VSA5_9PSEU|nr:excinuclease ABC subunit UvrC [Actinokineospora alba]TDP70115.1 excinuclease ABC subunit C [Actinokineospora alba]SDI38732.1 excinuclease ABC subunit C [Actinokineospora alba]SDP81462.1 Excinuclease ABC subunit C [Actinokineospora alba]